MSKSFCYFPGPNEPHRTAYTVPSGEQFAWEHLPMAEGHVTSCTIHPLGFLMFQYASGALLHIGVDQAGHLSVARVTEPEVCPRGY